MLPEFSARRITRRGMLRGAAILAGVSALPLLQACASSPAAPTAAPAAPAAPVPTPQVVTKEVTSVVTQVVEKQVTSVVTQVVQQQVIVTATPVANPLASIKITGNLQIIQERGFNPLQTQYIHNLLLKTAADNGWPLDKSYAEAFTGGGNFFEKMAAVVASGDSPDLYFGSQDTFQLWNQKSVQPVDDVVQWAIGQFGAPAPGQKLTNYIASESKWYGVPYFAATGGFWARKSWFDPIGFDVTKQATLQDWLDACLKVSDASKKRWGWGNTVNRSGDGETNVTAVVFQAGGRVTTEDNKIAFNTPETIAGFDWLKDLYTNPKWAPALPPGVNAWTDPSNNEAILAGTVGMSSNAGTVFATAIKTKPDIAADMWLAPHPSGSVGQKQSLIVSGPGWFQFQMFQGAKNPDGAKAITQILLSQANQKAVWDNSPGHSVPAYTWGWDEPELAKVPNNCIKESKDIILSDKLFKWFLPQAQPKLWINAVSSQVVYTDTMADILKGTPTKDAVAKGAATIQKIYDKFQGQ